MGPAPAFQPGVASTSSAGYRIPKKRAKAADSDDDDDKKKSEARPHPLAEMVHQSAETGKPGYLRRIAVPQGKDNSLRSLSPAGVTGGVDPPRTSYSVPERFNLKVSFITFIAYIYIRLTARGRQVF